jgi:hypothetical protein
MKQRVTEFTFSASARTITFVDVFSLSQLLFVTNVTDGVLIYNFGDPNCGGSMSGRSLNLEYDTSSMLDTDELLIYAETADVPAATEDTQISAVGYLQRILSILLAPFGYDKSLGRYRGTVAVETLPTLATVTTVTGVTTVSTLSQIDGVQGRVLPLAANLTAWASMVRNRIS